MTPNDLLCPLETARHRLHGAPVHSGRIAWESLLANVGSGGFFITLGFRVYLDQARAVEVANHFLLRVNRRLFGKRFRRDGQSLVGAVVIEHKQHSTRSSNSPHFHFVVSSESFTKFIVSEGKLRVVVEREAGCLRYTTLSRSRPLGPTISGSDFVDVKRIRTADGLANYLTKECKNFGSPNAALNIGFFGLDGIAGLQATH